MMKKIFLLSGLMMLSATAVLADDVQKIDGSKLSQITFEGDKVILHYKDGTTADATFDMADITIELSSATSIEERMAITEKAGLEGKAVYNLNGQLVGNSAARLPKGLYIIGGKKVIIK